MTFTVSKHPKTDTVKGFRSTPHNARQLDPEFEAFQAGNIPLDHTFAQSSQFQPQPFQPGPSNWAGDFQQLAISSPPPQLQSSFGGSQLQQKQNAGWHQEFSRQNQSNIASTAQPQYGYSSQPSPFMMGQHSGMGFTSQFAGASTYQQQPQLQQAEEGFDEAAFEAAFQAAAQVESQGDSSQIETTQETSSSSEQVAHSSSALLEARTLDEAILAAPQMEDTPLDQPLIGSDTIHDPMNPEEQQQQLPTEESDALAQTAQRLIDSLSGDTGQKLQGSEFMKLMRGFASREQAIVGDEVITTTLGTEGMKVV